MIIINGKKYKYITTQDLYLRDIWAIFFPKDETEKYRYLGYTYPGEKKESQYYKSIMRLVYAMDEKAKPWYCPRWFLRFLELFGNDNSIVRVRNFKLHNLHKKLTKGYRVYDIKTKWEWYDLRISIAGDEELSNLVNSIEKEYYSNGLEIEGKNKLQPKNG
jgi:hypothetical protein